MKAGLSKREKTMLYILLCFLIVVGGFFLVVSPCLNMHDKAAEKLKQVQMEKTVMQRTLNSYADTLKALENSRALLKEKQEPFYKKMTNEELDKELQKVTTRFGLQPVGLSMGDTEDIKVQEFYPENRSDPNKEPKTIMAQVNLVSLQLNGTGTAMVDLLEEFSNMKTLRVTNLEMETENMASVQTFTVTMEVYMVE